MSGTIGRSFLAAVALAVTTLGAGLAPACGAEPPPERPTNPALHAALRKAIAREVVQPLDAPDRARRALEGFMSHSGDWVDATPRQYRMIFDCWLLPEARRNHSRWELGDASARAILAWTALRAMTGDQSTGRDVQQGQLEFVLSMLHPETGLVWYGADRAKGVYRYHIWDQSRTLRALVRWYKTYPKDRPRVKPLIDRMIAGLDKYATVRGTDPTWGPYAGWPADDFTNQEPGKRYGGHFVNNRAGICIEPLAEYAEAAGDAAALDLAVRFANCELGGHEADDVPDQYKGNFRFGPDGSFAAHFHTKTSTLLGITKLAKLLASKKRLPEAVARLRAVRKSYDWILSARNPARGSRIGWMPESPGRDVHETCCAADVIELAEAMASCAGLDPELRDWVDLHDDVESMTVNMIARLQIRLTPEFKAALAERYGDRAAEQLRTAQLLEGSWIAIVENNSLIWHYQDRPCIAVGACCQYAGVRGLYSGWRDAMDWADGRLRIQFFLNRRSPQAVMTTAMPAEGSARITLREPGAVLIRVPRWLKVQEMSFQVNGRDARPVLEGSGHYVDLGRLGAGAKIDVKFPLSERSTTEKIARRQYTIRWRGNYVVELSPPPESFPVFP